MIKDKLETDSFEAQFANLELGWKVKNDPFRRIPYDILHMLVEYLPGKSLLALSSASWAVNCATRDNNNLWTRVIQLDIPWCFELHYVLREWRPVVKSKKRLYLWVNSLSTPVYGMSGPMMSIANRKRIWSACEQIAEAYFKRVRQNVPFKNDEEKSTIMSQSEVRQMATSLFPESDEAIFESGTTQWVHSWSEVDYWPSCFETFWNENKDLAGVSITVGGDKRQFGRLWLDGLYDFYRQEIPSKEWLTGLVLYLSDGHLPDEDKQLRVEGVEVSPPQQIIANMA